MLKKEYLYRINDSIKDTHRNLRIEDRQIRMVNRKDNKNYKTRMYNISCLNCGWTNFWMEESQLKRGRGCSCCSGKTVVAEINSVAHTHPWVINYFIGGYDEASKYTKFSEKRIVFRCPYCKDTSQPYLISNIIKNHGFSCSCRTSISFPEVTMKKLLDKLNIKYIHQLTNTYFSWVGKYRYDFYLPEYKTIIETHGKQHYEETGFTKRSLQEEIDNDKIKMQLAKYNSIDYYFVIDCSESSIQYIQKSILSSQKLCSLLNITEKSFNELFLYDDNEYVNICNLWNSTKDSISTISKKLSIDRERVKNFLILSAKNGHTNFSDEIMNIRKSIYVSQKSNPIRCKNNDFCFKNVYLCESLSQNLFGITLYKSSIAYNIHKNKLYNGFLFEYITKEQFNKSKRESPEKCFGDSFII